jgi:hypothetical protein
MADSTGGCNGLVNSFSELRTRQFADCRSMPNNQADVVGTNVGQFHVD